MAKKRLLGILLSLVLMLGLTSGMSLTAYADDTNLTSTKFGAILTTLTNTDETEKTQVSVQKVWADNNNAAQKRPVSIKVQLYADGQALGSPVTLDESNRWSYSWSNLTKYVNESGRSGYQKAIAYTVDETAIPEGYVGKVTGSAETGFVITNTYKNGKLIIEKEFEIPPWDPFIPDDSLMDIPVIKTWNDNNNKDGNRPGSVVVRLSANGREVANAELNAGNNWRYTFYGMPRLDEDKEKINYTITEDPVKWYTAQINGFNIRNNYEPELTSATVTMTWDDANNEMQTRPESIVMTLSNGMTVLLNDQNNWTATINDLPTRLNGKSVNYTWTEQKVLGYDKVAVVTEGTVTTFMNRRSQATLTAGGTPKTAGDDNYQSLSAYTTTCDGLTETNALRTGSLNVKVSLDAPKGADLSGLKLAIDGPDPMLKKTLTYADVKKGTVSLGRVLEGAYLIRDTNADTLIEGYVMDPANSKVADAVYVKSGYESGYENGYVPTLEFKYTWKPQEPIDKEVEDYEDYEDYDPYANIDNLTFEILGPDAMMPRTIKYSDFTNGKYELPDLAPGVYTVVERNAETLVKYYTLRSNSITGQAVEVKAGGTVTAKLTNQYVTPPTPEPDPEFVDIPVTKTWNDNDNEDGNRPASVTVRLYADGVEVDSHVLTAAENWQFTFVKKPRYQDDNKTEIVYTVGEDAVAMYAATVNGYNIVNDYKPEVTSVSVSKIWDDNNNEQNLRPDSIAMSLSDGQKVVKVVVLNQANGWTATVNNLPTVVNGQPAEYAWKEQKVLSYTLEGVTQQGNLTTFTNKVRERPEPSVGASITIPKTASAPKATSVKISTKSKTFKARVLKKKARTFKIKYKKAKGSGKAVFTKVKGSKKLKVLKSGKVKIKKGTKKGTYKIKVKVTVAANKKYKAETAVRTIKVKIK